MTFSPFPETEYKMKLSFPGKEKGSWKGSYPFQKPLK